MSNLVKILPKFTIAKDNLSQIKKILGKTNCLEIGFGNGEHLLFQALNNRDSFFIGCEPYLTGNLQLVNKINANKLDNICLYQDDARDILDALPNESLDKIFILFPDPWPKKRHNKRRLINDETIELIISKMKLGGALRFVTDFEDYAEWSISYLINFNQLEWKISSHKAYHKQPEDWVSTKYYRKALKNNSKIYYLNFFRTI